MTSQVIASEFDRSHDRDMDTTNDLSIDRGRFLRSALYANGAFSTTSGVVLAAGASGLDEWLGLPAWLLLVTGVGLILYAAYLVSLARRPNTLAIAGRTAVAGDVGWVVLAVGAVVGFDWLTDRGEWALLAVTLVVADLAVTQAIGLRRLVTKDGAIAR